MKTYNTVIVGAGASGILAGIYLDDKNSLILEKNKNIGNKLLITGGGRCNITNNNTLEEYVKKHYYHKGNFYRTAFNTFFNKDIINLLEENGCKTKVEDENRVFPVSDKSHDVVKTLKKLLDNSNTHYKLNSEVTSIEKKEDFFLIEYNNSTVIKSKYLVLSTGGKSYPQTGSTGDGERFANSLGHSKTNFVSGLSPLKIKEDWIRKLQGISINVYFEIKSDNKSLIKDSGSIMFTHNGISGIPILNNSMLVEKSLKKNKKVIIQLDLSRNYNYDELDKKLQEDFVKYSNQGLKRYLSEYMPNKMVVPFLNNVSIDSTTKLNQVTRKERLNIVDSLKKLELTIDEVLINESMVTHSGVKQKEINPDTFESRIVENLFIVGELVEGCGTSGGYNLQQAYSTGVLATLTIKERLSRC